MKKRKKHEIPKNRMRTFRIFWITKSNSPIWIFSFYFVSVWFYFFFFPIPSVSVLFIWVRAQSNSKLTQMPSNCWRYKWVFNEINWKKRNKNKLNSMRHQGNKMKNANIIDYKWYRIIEKRGNQIRLCISNVLKTNDKKSEKKKIKSTFIFSFNLFCYLFYSSGSPDIVLSMLKQTKKIFSFSTLNGQPNITSCSSENTLIASKSRRTKETKRNKKTQQNINE